MKSKKMLAVLLGMMILMPTASVMAKSQVNVVINNEKVNFKEAKPFVDSNNRTLVPVRFISEELGAKVAYDQTTKEIKVTSEDTEAVLTIGQKNIVINGKSQAMDTAPTIKDSAVYVPVKYIGEALGVSAKWDGKTSTITITKVADENAVVATVDGIEITQKDVQEQLDYELAMIQYQYQYDDSVLESDEMKEYIEARKSEIVDYLIKNKVVAMKAKELGLEPTDKQVEAQYNQIKASYNDDKAFEEGLKAGNYTEASYKEKLKENITISNLIQNMSSSVQVTQGEVTAYYNKHIDEFTQPAGAYISHILVATEQEAKDIKAEYEKGTSFELLATKYGTDGTKANGGALGYISYDSESYDKDFLAGAKTLEEGQVSDPVKTMFGWHLIKVKNVHKEDFKIPLADVQEDIADEIASEKTDELVNAQVEKWMSEVDIKRN